MAISVRMDPLLEQELATAAKRLGATKSQFIVNSVERALGRKNPVELMHRLQAEEPQAGHAISEAFKGAEPPYDTEASRQRLLAQLTDKHGAGSAG